MKFVMDMVFNHIGTNHWLVKDIPDSNWVHYWDEGFTRSNFRGEVNIDPYRSESDLKKMEQGWFDNHMADLNQNNAHVMRYLTQNSIWWVEHLGHVHTLSFSFKSSFLKPHIEQSLELGK